MPVRAVLWAYGITGLALCVPVTAKLMWDIPPEAMLRDGVSVMGAPVYTGALSNLGLVLWGGAAAVCFFAAAVRKDARGFWMSAGALTVVLLADDWLLLHEHAFPVYLGISEYLVYGTYGAALLLYLVSFRAMLWRADWPLLLLAFTWFAISLGVDRLDGLVEVPALYLWEDGAKLFGIVSWLLFHGRLAGSTIAARPN